MGVKRLGLGVGLALVLAMGVPARPELAVTFLDVGQGDAILLEDGAAQVLVDGGEGRVVLERLAEEISIFDRRIEALVVSHPQRDHLEGLLSVLERYEVGMVLLANVAHDSQLQEAWLAMLLERGVPVKMAQAGQRFSVGRWSFVVLGPLPGEAARLAVEEDINNGSVMVRAEGCPGGEGRCLSLLLTGDAEAPVENMLVRAAPAAALDVDVLKAGHHGSKSSTTAGLIEAASPSLAVISVGAENTFGHPHPTVLKRLADFGVPVLRTDEAGSVKLWWGGEGWMLDAGQ